MSASLYSVLCLLLTTLRLTFPYCLRVCLALLSVMFIAYLVVSLLLCVTALRIAGGWRAE